MHALRDAFSGIALAVIFFKLFLARNFPRVPSRHAPACIRGGARIERLSMIMRNPLASILSVSKKIWTANKPKFE
jgi:hypothetical protein